MCNQDNAVKRICGKIHHYDQSNPKQQKHFTGVYSYEEILDVLLWYLDVVEKVKRVKPQQNHVYYMQILNWIGCGIPFLHRKGWNPHGKFAALPQQNEHVADSFWFPCRISQFRTTLQIHNTSATTGPGLRLQINEDHFRVYNLELRTQG